MTMFRLRQSKKWCKTEVLTDDRVTLLQMVKEGKMTTVNYRVYPSVASHEGRLMSSGGAGSKGCPKNWFMASWTMRSPPGAAS